MLTLRETPAGRVLERDGAFVSCDTALLREYYAWVAPNLWGKVLITGLGLGLLPSILCKQEAVKLICVLESDLEIIDRFSFKDLKVVTLQGDAWTWQPSTVFDWAFHDIWSDNLAEDVPQQEEQIKRLYKPFVQAGQITLPNSYAEFLNVASR